MSQYIIRLDDASPKCNIGNWERIEMIFDQYMIKPIVGVIPKNEDTSFDQYKEDLNFWNRVHQWENKGWSIALHGYRHVYETAEGGINPFHCRSEFAGQPLTLQKEKIASAIKIMRKNGINPRIFFAPSHTFDENTLIALKDESDIRIISDTIAMDVYYDKDFFFIPQQCGQVRRLPFKIVTFCYHPDTMTNTDFMMLERFLKSNKRKFISIEYIKFRKRKLNFIDSIIRKIYFYRRSYKH